MIRNLNLETFTLRIWPYLLLVWLVAMWIGQKLGIGFRQSNTTYLLAGCIAGLAIYASHFHIERARIFFKRLCSMYAVELVLFGLFLLIYMHLFRYTLPRRLAFMVAIAPIIAGSIHWLWIKAKRTPMGLQIPTGLFGITLVMAALPGAILPPFYDGIPGWVFTQRPLTTLSLNGLRLVRDDEATVWFAPGITQPITFQDRHFNGLHSQRGDEGAAAAFNFYIQIYCRNYSSLSKGTYPHQYALGPFSYPPHQPFVRQDYAKFPPARLKRFEKVTLKYDANTRQKLDEKIRAAANITVTASGACSARLGD